MLKKLTESMRERVQIFVAEMQAETGLSVVEMILIYGSDHCARLDI